MPLSDYKSKIPILNSCCFFFELEMGTIILGWTGLILNIASFITTVIGVGSVPAAAGQLVLNIFSILLYAGLLYGVYKKRPSFVLVWLVVNLILCFLFVVDIIILIVYLNLPAVIFAIVNLLISIYFELVVHSYYIGVTGQT